MIRFIVAVAVVATTPTLSQSAKFCFDYFSFCHSSFLLFFFSILGFLVPFLFKERARDGFGVRGDE